MVSRRGSLAGPVDTALEALGLHRRIVAVVPGFPDALRIARQTDLVALAPRSCLGIDPQDDVPVPQTLVGFELPVSTPDIAVSAMWHPRMDADPAHRWLRDMVIALCNRRVMSVRVSKATHRRRTQAVEGG